MVVGASGPWSHSSPSRCLGMRRGQAEAPGLKPSFWTADQLAGGLCEPVLSELAFHLGTILHGRHSCLVP